MLLKDVRGWKRGLAAQGSGFPRTQGIGHSGQQQARPQAGCGCHDFQTWIYTNPQANTTPLPRALTVLKVVEEEGVCWWE